ncbi:MAG: hypothetical protein IPI93_06110 [Sphingobacteriaceae bacterium]|nr:hypothetical protein [Sphingobacteriaceae bacterium]MBK7816339.1 hypothetical protein [Sphingobacteriaceae bacterium]
MDKEIEILNELKKLNTVLSKVLGSSELTESKRFSKESIDKAAKEFQKLAIQRGEWVKNEGISKYIKNAPYNPAKFIIEELKFGNYFKRGHQYYLNKTDLIKLGQELKDRDVNLKRYLEFKDDKAKFDKYLKKVLKNPSKIPYELPEDMLNITTSKPPSPLISKIREHVKQLKREFEECEYGKHIDVYQDSYAMFKDFYRYRDYLDKDLLRRLNKWRDDFNLANSLIHEFGRKRSR